VIVKVPAAPESTVEGGGLAEMVKSTTWNVTVALWESGPLVLETWTTLFVVVE
jgi:hypothetical protein